MALGYPFAERDQPHHLPQGTCARTMPIRAGIVGPPDVATRITARL
jgi:hypothetical protein